MQETHAKTYHLLVALFAYGPTHKHWRRYEQGYAFKFRSRDKHKHEQTRREHGSSVVLSTDAYICIDTNTDRCVDKETNASTRAGKN